MPLETFTDPDAHLNIKDISFDSAERKYRPHFLPERDLTAEDWKEMIRVLWTKKDNPYDFVTTASEVAILNHDRIVRLINEDDWRRIMALLRDFQNDAEKREFGFSSVASSIAALDRERMTALITNNDWRIFGGLLEEQRNNGWWRDFADHCSRLATLDSVKTLSLIRENDWESMLTRLEVYRGERGFFHMAASLTTLDSSKIIGLIDDGDWEHAKKLLDDYAENGQWHYFIELTSALTILSRAEQNMVDNQQLQNSTTPPMPEVRQF